MVSKNEVAKVVLRVLLRSIVEVRIDQRELWKSQVSEATKVAQIFFVFKSELMKDENLKLLRQLSTDRGREAVPYSVDCEWNRAKVGTDGKASGLDRFLITDGGNPTTRRLDMNVHRRGGSQTNDNIMVIEFKNADFSKGAVAQDVIKVMGAVLHYKYELGVVVSLGVRPRDSVNVAVLQREELLDNEEIIQNGINVFNQFMEQEFPASAAPTSEQTRARVRQIRPQLPDLYRSIPMQPLELLPLNAILPEGERADFVTEEIGRQIDVFASELLPTGHRWEWQEGGFVRSVAEGTR